MKAVLTVAAYTNLNYSKDIVPCHKVIDADDIESFDMSVYLEEGI